MSKQVGTSPMTIKQCIRKAAFVKGFKDAKAGKPFDYDFEEGNISNQWAYERGRQFAILFAGQLKRGNKISLSAEYGLGMAITARAII